MKIYTRTGDKGETSLLGGKRVSKANLRVEAYGTVDELNSVIGVALSVISNKQQVARRELIKIQHDLLEIGSALASSGNKNYEARIKNLEMRVRETESFIDKLTKELSELRNFILPGGRRAGALLHQARTICRRAERRVVELAQKESVPQEILVYINRLSDLLFTMARFINYKENKKETIWKKRI